MLLERCYSRFYACTWSLCGPERDGGSSSVAPAVPFIPVMGVFGSLIDLIGGSALTDPSRRSVFTLNSSSGPLASLDYASIPYPVRYAGCQPRSAARPLAAYRPARRRSTPRKSLTK